MIDLVTDKNGVTWICFKNGVTVKKQQKPLTIKKPVRRYSDFEFKIRTADSYDELGSDNLYFDIKDVDGFVSAYSELLTQYSDVDCEVVYYDREYGIEYCELDEQLPYWREQKLMQQALDKLSALGLPLSQYSE